MRLIALVPMVVFVLTSQSVFTQGWIEYVNVDDRFAINFPGEPAVSETTYMSEYGAPLPAREYVAESGGSRYSMTVVDYSDIERMLTEKSALCAPGDEPCRGFATGTGYGYWKIDVAAVLVYASWNYLQKGAELTHYSWTIIDLVEGHQLLLTNANQSRSFVGIFMHENRLFIMDGTVPEGYPEPGLFYQSLQFLNSDGDAVRYQEFYNNVHPAPDHITRDAGADDPAFRQRQ